MKLVHGSLKKEKISSWNLMKLQSKIPPSKSYDTQFTRHVICLVAVLYLSSTGVVKHGFSCIADKITVTYGKEIDSESKEEMLSSLGFCGNYLSDQSQGPTDRDVIRNHSFKRPVVSLKCPLIPDK